MSDWKNMDRWYAVLPPSRPTYTEIARIKSYLINIDKDEPIAVLGSTPEFRELLFQLGFKYRFVFDKSLDFYQRMGMLIPNSVSIDEHFINGEWSITLNEYSNLFKVVLSDLTMGNVSYGERECFYTAISNTIKNGGVFIDKVLAFDFQIPTLDELFDKYEYLPINLCTINNFSSEVLFCSELVKRENIVDSTKFYEIIRKGAYSEKIKFFAEAAHIITPEGFVWSYGKEWCELKKNYFKYYSTHKTFIEEDNNSPYYHRTKQFFNYK